MRIIAGAYKGRTLKTTTGPGFRPAMSKVREALFSMLEAQGVVWQNTRVLDLFAGSGSLGFEALSRGAALVCFVDSASYASKVIAQNAELLQVEPKRYNIIHEQAGKALAKFGGQSFSVIFIDPPYQLQTLSHTLQTIMKNRLLTEGGVINAEVEASGRLESEKAHPDLISLADRTYGQTRVLLWTHK